MKQERAEDKGRLRPYLKVAYGHGHWLWGIWLTAKGRWANLFLRADVGKWVARPEIARSRTGL